jgi:hypothetical protein
MGVYTPATFELPRVLRLKHPVSADRALEVLNERINVLDNLPGATANTGPHYPIARRDAYLTWVETTEVQLSELTHDETVIGLLQTSRYWAIRDLDLESGRPIPLIEGEIRSRRDVLHSLRMNLEMRVARARNAPGHITVLDTNTLLHYQLPDSIRWPEVVGHEEVRLVIPLRVVEELDAKKYGDSQKLRDRARGLLPRLEKLIGLGGAPAPLGLGSGATLEVPIEFESGAPRIKPVDADEEILFTCRELWQLSGQADGVTLVTADTATRIRAQALGGIRPVAPPEKYRRDTD